MIVASDEHAMSLHAKVRLINVTFMQLKLEFKSFGHYVKI